MGLSPSLCRVVKPSTKLQEDFKNGETTKLYRINMFDFEQNTPENVRRAAAHERWLILNKFHDFIVYDDAHYDEYTKVYKEHMKGNLGSDFIIEKFSNDNKMVDILIPDPKNPVNYMQLEHYWGRDYEEIDRLKATCTKHTFPVSEIETTYTIKCPYIYYRDVDDVPMKFSCFKQRTPKWLFGYGYVVTNSKLMAYLKYLKKSSYGYESIKEIVDRGGLKDDEFIDMGY